MLAIFKRELRSYFTGLTGYIFIAFILLFAGIYAMVYNLENYYVNFEYVFGGITMVFIVVVPILTMRIFADERRSKTDQLLYSLPISSTEIVVGKFLALAVCMLVPLLVLAVYPLILSKFGNLQFDIIYSTMFAFYLLGLCLLAIGMFISSITESQAACAGLCFVVMLLNYFLSSIMSYVSENSKMSFIALSVLIVVVVIFVWIMMKNLISALIVGCVLMLANAICYMAVPSVYEGLFPDIMSKLSVFDRFYSFINGIFDISGIIYFLTVIVLFIYLTVQSLEKRRWSA